jgi:hypothetical protein
VTSPALVHGSERMRESVVVCRSAPRRACVANLVVAVEVISLNGDDVLFGAVPE